MKFTNARLILVGIFIVAFLLQLAAIVTSSLRDRIYIDEVKDLIIMLLRIYSIPFGVILGGIFVKRGKQKSAESSSFWVALIMSSIWNLLLIWQTFMFGFLGKGTNVELSDYLNTISSFSSFLVAGALSFFFAKQG